MSSRRGNARRRRGIPPPSDGNELRIDLSPWQEPAKLIDAIWEVRRGERRDLLGDVAQLLDHEDPTVREEAVSLLFVKWRDRSQRQRLIDLVCSDPDFAVRSRAAGAIAMSSTPDSRTKDIELLRGIVLNRGEDAVVRKTSYEALYQIVNGAFISLDDDTDIDEDLDLEWVGQA